MQSRTILVVDDEWLIRNIIHRTLERHGFTVVTACNGEEALTMLEQFQKSLGESIDLVITDLHMPVMDGHQLIAKMRERNYEVKLLVISGKDSDRRPELETQGILFLPKPFFPITLLKKVHELLG